MPVAKAISYHDIPKVLSHSPASVVLTVAMEERGCRNRLNLKDFWEHDQNEERCKENLEQNNNHSKRKQHATTVMGTPTKEANKGKTGNTPAVGVRSTRAGELGKNKNSLLDDIREVKKEKSKPFK